MDFGMQQGDMTVKSTDLHAAASLDEVVKLDEIRLNAPTGPLYLLKYLDSLEEALQQAEPVRSEFAVDSNTFACSLTHLLI